MIVVVEYYDFGKRFLWTENEYDEYGRVIKSSDFYDAHPNSDLSWVEYKYDDDSDKASKVEFYNEHYGGLTTVIEYKYDSNNNVKEEITRDYSDYTSDITGEHVFGGGEITSDIKYTYEYDEEGLLISVKETKSGEVKSYKEYKYEKVIE